MMLIETLNKKMADYASSSFLLEYCIAKSVKKVF